MLMADARQREAWGRLSALLATIANVNRDPKKPPAKPSDFDPHQRKASRAARPASHAADMSILKDAFAAQKSRKRD